MVQFISYIDIGCFSIFSISIYKKYTVGLKMPFSMDPEYQAAQRAYMRYHNMNPIFGISSKYVYITYIYIYIYDLFYEIVVYGNYFVVFFVPLILFVIRIWNESNIQSELMMMLIMSSRRNF